MKRAVLVFCKVLCAAAALAASGTWFAVAMVFTPSAVTVNETGAAIISIPIRVPPGTAGMEPKLSFVYNSQAGNGLLGVGWSLAGLSAISRCGRTIAQDGVTGGVQYDANDRFCLDGQRLIATSGTYGANGTEYRTERETFTRIISFDTAGSGPAYFRAWTKSGQILEFGNSTGSRIEAAGQASVRVWALNRIQDTKGNYLTIEYTEDNTNGDFRPDRINYTGNAGASLAPGQSVRFTYQTRTDNPPAIFIGGSIIKTMQRLVNAKTYVGETLVLDYRLAYNYSSGDQASLISSITECATDGSCLPATSFGWQVATGTTGFGSAAPWNGMTSDISQVRVGDINGDGLADLVLVEESLTRLWYQLSTGSGFSAAVLIGSHPTCGVSGGTCQIALGDVNGDGLADIVSSNGSVRLSTGAGFAAAAPWNGMTSDISQTRVGDINGDGLADLVLVEESLTRLWYQLSTGSGFSAAVLIGSHPTCGVGGGTCQIALGDVNGDGRADIVSANGSVRLSTGAGFTAAAPWNGITSDVSQTRVGDINGDGLADLVLVEESLTRLWYQLSTGSGFSAAVLIGSHPTCGVGGGTCQIALGDVSGEGRADIVSINGTVRATNAITPNQITTVTTGLGLITTIVHKALTDGTVYAHESGAVWPVRDVLRQGPLNVVSSVSVANPVGGNLVTDYFYRGAKAHMKGHGFLGFRVTETTDAQSLIKTTVTSRQDFPFIGLPSQIKRTKSGGATLSQVDNTYSCNDFTGGCTVGIGKRYFVFASQSDELGYDFNGTFMTRVRTNNNNFDSFGNVQQIVVTHLTEAGAATGYSKTTNNIFFNDQTNWILGRLTRSTVASAMP